MNNPSIEARELIAQAREALRRADKVSARQLGEQAALLAPDLEDAWLILAASDPDPHEALAYARKALELNPQGRRAHQAMEWAAGRIKPAEAALERTAPMAVVPVPAQPVPQPPEQHAYQTAVAMPVLQRQGRSWVIPALLTGALCLVLGVAALFTLTRPAFRSLASNLPFAAATAEILWAEADIVKPEGTPAEASAFTPPLVDTPIPPGDDPAAQVEPTRTPRPTRTPAPEATQAAADEPEDAATLPPAATETPGTMVMEIVVDTPTSEYVAPDNSLSTDEIASIGNGARWIDVNLSQQMVYAYEGDVLVNSFVVSTGVAQTPTVTGKYKIYVKVRVQDMRGPGYHLRDVPWVMFFYGDYGLHGTYWHNNFGIPMSRGCVNLTIDDAAWLFNWASVGTVVNVHY